MEIKIQAFKGTGSGLSLPQIGYGYGALIEPSAMASAAFLARVDAAFQSIDSDGSKLLDAKEVQSVLGAEYASWFAQHAGAEIQDRDWVRFFTTMVAEQGNEYAEQVLADVEASVQAYIEHHKPAERQPEHAKLWQRWDNAFLALDTDGSKELTTA